MGFCVTDLFLRRGRRRGRRESVARRGIPFVRKRYYSIEHERQNVEGPSKGATERNNRASDNDEECKTDVCGVNPGILAMRARTHDKNKKNNQKREDGESSIGPLRLCCSGVEDARSLERTQSPARLVEN